MEKPASTNSKTKALAEIYQTDHWHNQYERHGIGARYFDKWFFNYICTTDMQKTHMETILKNNRRNRPMAFLGGVGNGKTHLACAILKDAIICGSGQPKRKISDPGGKNEHHGLEKEVDAGHYYTMTSLFRAYRDSISTGETKFIQRITKMKCLIIDEIQIKSDSDSEQRMFQEIIDLRYDSQKQTIFVGNLSIKEFQDILGERLVDRGREQDLKVLLFNEKSYRSFGDKE